MAEDKGTYEAIKVTAEIVSSCSSSSEYLCTG